MYCEIAYIEKQRSCIIIVMGDAPSEKLLTALPTQETYTYKKGEVVLRPQVRPRGVYLLKSGYVRCYSLSLDGQELTFIIFKKDDFFPMGWAFRSSPIRYYYETMTPVTLGFVSRRAFLKLLHEHPDLCIEYAVRMHTRLGGMMQRLEGMAFRSVSERVYELIMLCGERFGKHAGKTTRIQVPLVHRDIASLVGASRETVSLEMRKLKEKGIVSYKRGNIVINKRVRLS